LRGAVILAGGASKRFGSNKALAKFKDKELIKWCIEGLENLVDELFISVKKKENFKEFEVKNVKVVEDICNLEGPLVGVYSCLLKMESSFVYLHPVDSPFIINEFIEFMFKKCEGYNGCVIIFEDGTINPTHSVIERSIALFYSKKLLEKGITDLKSLFFSLPKINYVRIQDVRIYEKALFNINTPEDLKNAYMI